MAEPIGLENDSLRLDVGLEPALQVSVTDKRSGFVWQCPGAPFTLHYWDPSHLGMRRCPTDAAHGWDVRLLPEDGRLALQYTWPRAACSFRAALQLEGSALEVLVPGRRLVENRPFRVRLMALDVLPGLGAARTGAEGFLLIPSELGVLARFSKTDEAETALLFYAGDERPLTAPVFGIGRGSAGLLGIVADGEYNAELVVTRCGGPDRDLHCLSPRLNFRFESADLLVDIDQRVRYAFLAGADASWVGMARAYRRFLLDVHGAWPLAKRIDARPLLGYAAGAATVHVHLAEKRRTTSMSGDGELRVQTRFEEAARIAEELKAQGLEKAVIVLVGWNCEGRDGLYPTRFPVESALGGADAMARAVKAISALGFQPGAVDNYTDMYRRSPAFNRDFSAKQLGGEPWRGGVWAGGQSYVICPREARERYAQRDMRRLRDLGLAGLLFLDHCPGPGVLRCCDPDHPVTRHEYALHLREIIRAAQSTFGLCRVSDPSVFAALDADTCMVPVVPTSPVEPLEPSVFEGEAVPFIPAALHGVVLLAADADADPLRAAEYGAAPVFNATAGESGRAVPRIAALSRRYASALARLADQFIESHETPRDGVIVVGYSGGARVVVNRTDEPVEAVGIRVPPRDFQVKL